MAQADTPTTTPDTEAKPRYVIGRHASDENYCHVTDTTQGGSEGDDLFDVMLYYCDGDHGAARAESLDGLRRLVDAANLGQQTRADVAHEISAMLRRRAHSNVDGHVLRFAASLIEVEFADGLLAAGTRIRNRRHPELTGAIKNIERRDNGEPSGIPYCIGWDDPGRACAVLGMLFVYASNSTVEPVA